MLVFLVLSFVIMVHAEYNVTFCCALFVRSDFVLVVKTD
jgi:hypothetical protein